MGFHDATLAVAGLAPVTDAAALRALRAVERRHQFTAPASLREWLTTSGSHKLLGGPADVAIPIADLGQAAERWYGGGPRDFVREGLLPILWENQGVCWWAVTLDGSDDPTVLVAVDEPAWRPCAESFSEFAFARVFDNPNWPFWAIADTGPLSQEHLNALVLAGGTQQVTTSGWPTATETRWLFPSGRVRLQTAASGVQWYACSEAEASFAMLLQQLAIVAPILDTAYGSDLASEAVLARVRATIVGAG